MTMISQYAARSRRTLSVLWVSLGDDLFDLFAQSVQKLRLGQGSHLDAVAVDQPHAFAAGNAHVCHRRFARSVDGAAHDRYLHRRAVFRRHLLDGFGQLEDVHLHAAAGRTRGDLGAAFADPERLEDLPADWHFLDWIGGERDADRVADSVGEEHAEADAALDRAGAQCARFGDAEVERIVALDGEHAIRGDRRADVMRLERDDDVAEIQLLEDADVAARGLHHAGRRPPERLH